MNRRSTRNRRHHATATAGGGGGFSPVTSVTSATCELWLDASLGITTVSGGVTAWADQSTTGDSNRDFAVAGPAFAAGGAANRPVYTATDAAYNNLPTLTFDENDDRLSNLGGAWSAAIAQEFTVFIVGECDGATGDDYFMSASNDLALVWNAGSQLFQYSGAAISTTQPTAPSVIAMRFDGASSALYVNSTTAAASGDASTGGFDRLSLGNYHGLDGYGLGGKIAEVLIYSTGLNATDRNAVIAYLGDKYGITIA